MRKEAGKTVFLWDIDGTLLLTGGSGRNAFSRVFRDLYGQENAWRDYSPAGKTDYLLIDELYSACFGKMPDSDEVRRIAETYRNYLAADVSEWSRFRLMPGARETLAKLSERSDFSLGIATGNFRDTAYLKLRYGGLDGYFSYGGFGCDDRDRLKLTRKALERAVGHLGEAPRAVYVIGDTVADVRCGRAIGARTVAVCVAGTPREDFRRAGADFVLDDLNEFFAKVGMED